MRHLRRKDGKYPAKPEHVVHGFPHFGITIETSHLEESSFADDQTTHEAKLDNECEGRREGRKRQAPPSGLAHDANARDQNYHNQSCRGICRNSDCSVGVPVPHNARRQQQDAECEIHQVQAY